MDPLIDLALLLFGAKLGGILFSKLRQPSIVGELIAGIILGPSLLSLVKESALVSSVSHLGLLFLILLVSLSIDWKILEGSTEKYVFIEFARIILTVAAVFVASWFFSWDTSTFLIIAFIVMLSSTAIASRTLADMRELVTPHGQTLMGLEVVDEVIGIVAVALLANMLTGQGFELLPIMTTIFVVVGMFVVMGRMGYRFINKLTGSIQRYGIEEALFGFTLLLAFLLGGLTEGLNLASILGVFLAGMILSRSAQSMIITRKVKEIGESFFIPIFFASVGLTVNLFATTEIIGLIAILVAAFISIKMLASIVSLKMFGYSDPDSLRIGAGFSTLSEMTIVIVALASTVISPTLYISLIASFVLVNTISPIIMTISLRKSHNFSLHRATTMKKRMGKLSGKAFKKNNSYVYRINSGHS